jgi:hypothetical protein
MFAGTKEANVAQTDGCLSFAKTSLLTKRLKSFA